MRRVVLAVAIAAVLGSGCQAPPAATVDAATPVSDREATMASLRKLDDHPLWTMRYQGGYDRFPDVAPNPPAPTFGCSVFAAHGDPADPVIGRNYDFPYQPALLLFTSPPDGYGSVSIVDTSFLGLTKDEDFRTDEGRQALLSAPLLPFDGMNSKGLVVAMATVPGSDAGRRPGLPTVGVVRIMRLVLDHAATVDEAVAVFDRYDLNFAEGPPLHYLVADARGHSAILEFIGGELMVHRRQGPWQVLVNTQVTGSDEKSRLADPRYRTASTALRAANGVLTSEQAMGLLADVRQGHTQWSVVYHQQTGKVSLATGRRYATVHELTLPMS